MTTTPDIRIWYPDEPGKSSSPLPEVEGYCELVDGVVYMAAFPIPDHQILAMILSTLFGPTDHGCRVWALCMHAARRRCGLADSSALGPDIIVVRAENRGIIGPTVINGAPDIVVEILSSDRNRDLVDKSRLVRGGRRSPNIGSWTVRATWIPSRNWNWATTGRTKSARR